MLTVLYGLASALVWGSADFAGGLATKKNNVYTVILLSQGAGALLIVFLIPLFGETFTTWTDVAVGCLAGISGAIGLIFFYRALARGPMGMVAPVTAVVTGGLPVVISFLNEGLPDGLQLAGIAMALPAVWLVSQGEGGFQRASLQRLSMPALAGMFFALFFILINSVSDRVILWPLAGARVASLSLMLCVIIFQRSWQPPLEGNIPLIALTGVLDMGGNAFFALAARAGRLDIAAVLAGLGPAVTVLLARSFLKERLIPKQKAGVLLALVAILLLAK